jgi:hypothetical protein
MASEESLRVYVTHNTEYHMRGNICIAVRDRKTGQFVDGHSAIGHRVAGSLHSANDGLPPMTPEPHVGDPMLFDQGMRGLITSPLERVTNPPAEVVAHSPSG